MEFSIAHERSREKYFQNWYDIEGIDESQKKTFTVTPLEQVGDLYIMVDTYPFYTVDPTNSACNT